ncbi:MAG: hypothetical protein A3H98_09295 [Bacteroidetes bacterium RIFCSPLOWO2_02_FULL_36_8]|nr:MAG: hypothetical protein A3H98_09295 [Bacteroidetes bacterium RIFCSPLOWO2_02_FULL_36_8]OFY69146.1 MAG: hypothetical protein A3G23_06255 [Bacteroidetes bacterium RIFCSPLOWO2_12_FULL_37_12]
MTEVQPIQVIKGNTAAAVAAKLCRVKYIPAYPITPQTTIIEEIASMIAKKEMDANMVNMESEHSVFSAALGSSMTGARTFTATSGQGLFYAHEVLHAIAHFRQPIVICNVGRPSIPWNIWADQSDSLSQRDTGWLQFYGESSQEILDSIIQGYKIAEKLSLPVMVVSDAFYQSHTSENVNVPEQELVDSYLPQRKISENTIQVESPKSFGGLVPPEIYDRFNKLHWEAMNIAEEETIQAGKEFSKIFGREYGAVEAVNINQNTKTILVALSTITTTIRGVLAKYPEVGLLKIRLFRPFPVISITEIMKSVSPECRMITIDRNYMGEKEGCVHQEMKRALYGKNFPIYDVYAGVGGKDVPPETIERIINFDFGQNVDPVWIDI